VNLCRKLKLSDIRNYTSCLQPNREDERARIEAAGGRVIHWKGYRVLGVLAMSRSIGMCLCMELPLGMFKTSLVFWLFDASVLACYSIQFGVKQFGVKGLKFIIIIFWYKGLMFIYHMNQMVFAEVQGQTLFSVSLMHFCFRP